MAKKILVPYDFAGNQLIDFRVENLASFPSAGKAGRLVLNTTTALVGWDTGTTFRAFAPLDSPALSGTPSAPTATAGTNTTQIATTAFVQSAVSAAASGDMTKAVYDTNNDGKVNAAHAADAVPWSGVTDKPASFTPSAHTHAIADVTGLQTALDGKAASSHTHTASQITDLTAEVQSITAAYWDTIAGTDANIDTIRELMDLVLSNQSGLNNLIGRFNADIGNGSSTSIAVTHNLGSLDVSVEVYEKATGETVTVGVTRTSANVVTISATPAPATNALRVVIKK